LQFFLRARINSFSHSLFIWNISFKHEKKNKQNDE
jgi:hypothetical protein